MTKKGKGHPATVRGSPPFQHRGRPSNPNLATFEFQSIGKSNVSNPKPPRNSTRNIPLADRITSVPADDVPTLAQRMAPADEHPLLVERIEKLPPAAPSKRANKKLVERLGDPQPEIPDYVAPTNPPLAKGRALREQAPPPIKPRLLANSEVNGAQAPSFIPPTLLEQQPALTLNQSLEPLPVRSSVEKEFPRYVPTEAPISPVLQSQERVDIVDGSLDRTSSPTEVEPMLLYALTESEASRSLHTPPPTDTTMVPEELVMSPTVLELQRNSTPEVESNQPVEAVEAPPFTALPTALSTDTRPFAPQSSVHEHSVEDGVLAGIERMREQTTREQREWTERIKANRRMEEETVKAIAAVEADRASRLQALEQEITELHGEIGLKEHALDSLRRVLHDKEKLRELLTTGVYHGRATSGGTNPPADPPGDNLQAPAPIDATGPRSASRVEVIAEPQMQSSLRVQDVGRPGASASIDASERINHPGIHDENCHSSPSLRGRTTMPLQPEIKPVQEALRLATPDDTKVLVKQEETTTLDRHVKEEADEELHLDDKSSVIKREASHSRKSVTPVSANTKITKVVAPPLKVSALSSPNLVASTAAAPATPVVPDVTAVSQQAFQTHSQVRGAASVLVSNTPDDQASLASAKTCSDTSIGRAYESNGGQNPLPSSLPSKEVPPAKTNTGSNTIDSRPQPRAEPLVDASLRRQQPNVSLEHVTDDHPRINATPNVAGYSPVNQPPGRSMRSGLCVLSPGLFCIDCRGGNRSLEECRTPGCPRFRGNRDVSKASTVPLSHDPNSEVHGSGGSAAAMIAPGNGAGSLYSSDEIHETVNNLKRPLSPSASHHEINKRARNDVPDESDNQVVPPDAGEPTSRESQTLHTSFEASAATQKPMSFARTPPGTPPELASFHRYHSDLASLVDIEYSTSFTCPPLVGLSGARPNAVEDTLVLPTPVVHTRQWPGSQSSRPFRKGSGGRRAALRSPPRTLRPTRMIDTWIPDPQHTRPSSFSRSPSPRRYGDTNTRYADNRDSGRGRGASGAFARPRGRPTHTDRHYSPPRRTERPPSPEIRRGRYGPGPRRYEPSSPNYPSMSTPRSPDLPRSWISPPVASPQTRVPRLSAQYDSNEETPERRDAPGSSATYGRWPPNLLSRMTTPPPTTGR